MARKNPESEETRESIRQTAAKLFCGNGVYATSLQDIADAAGLSKGTLYYHYPGKDMLVVEITEQYFAHITEAFYAWLDSVTAAMAARDAVAMLHKQLNRTGGFLKLYFALFSEALREDGPLRALMLSYQKEWALLAEMGALKLTDAASKRFRAFSHSYIALLDGLALHGLLNGEPNTDILLQLLLD
ncbi:MAG: TetR/AcrR family transcriptional regulator [Clostridiales bacterium]|jgi:AcrR family transcriptional regulator|nr:TetR/AcrR family transcriptional regulator [Clostridiales bacterium]